MSTATQQLISGVDFVGIPTHDLETAVAFYRDTLGLHHSGTCHEGHYAEFETSNLTLGIMDAEQAGLEHSPFRTPIALQVDDVAAARATLESRGVTFAGDTSDTGVCHMAYFADPDGNALMLHHRYKPRVTEA